MRFLIFGLLVSATAFGSVLFSDNFESGTLSDGNWGTDFSGAIVANPNTTGDTSSNVLEFDDNGSGGDLFSIVVPYSTDPNFIANGGYLTLTFDFLSTDPTGSGYIGTNHSSSGSSDEEWLWNNLGGGDYGGAVPPLNVWTHISITFQPRDTGHVGTIGVKLEENAGTVDTVFFDNIVLEAIPEPASLGLAVIGLLSGALLKSRGKVRR